MYYIYCDRPSNGALALVKELGAKRIRTKGSTYVPKRNDVVINWGCGGLPDRLNVAGLRNKPDAVHGVANKLVFFEQQAGVEYNGKRILPPWAGTLEGANRLLKEHGGSIVCRTQLSSSGGAGIVLASTERELVPARLYTLYIPKKEEYRVHVMDGKVIDVQQKARRKDVAEPNWKIRNLDGGFIYKRMDVHPPECVVGVALACMAGTSLNFGAVDVIYNDKERRAYVLEVNSAPGLEGTTVKNYAAAFKGV